jgi:Ca-activated chloride channel family protein
MTSSVEKLKRCAAAAALALFVALPSQAAAKPAIDASVDIDRAKVLRGYAGPIYVLIDLEAMTLSREQGSERPDLNLGLVLDRSGSMSDAGKMDYLKKAAGMAVDQLSGQDVLSVVEYDDQISLLWPSGPVESAYTIKRLINNLSPRGGTNLTGGMMRGVDEVFDAMGDNEPLTRVLLLSDGLANEGITDSREIKELVRQARLKGVRISTLGLGRDYDEDLMQAIAEYGGGHYYYIENPNQMSRIFQEELETLFSTVGRDAELDVDVTGKVERIELISFNKDLGKSGGQVDLSDFYSGESRTLVLRIEPEKDAFDHRGKVSLGEIELTYYDVEAKETRKISADIDVEVVTELAEAEAAVNKEVMVETALLETERKHREAIDLYESGKHEEANVAMASLASDVATLNESMQDKRLEQKYDAINIENDQMTSGKRTLYVLQEGDKGLEVEKLQTALKDAGFFEGDIDGQYSEDLKVAVEAYQKDQGLTEDGIAGPTTMQALGLY